MGRRSGFRGQLSAGRPRRAFRNVGLAAITVVLLGIVPSVPAAAAATPFENLQKKVCGMFDKYEPVKGAIELGLTLASFVAKGKAKAVVGTAEKVTFVLGAAQAFCPPKLTNAFQIKQQLELTKGSPFGGTLSSLDAITFLRPNADTTSVAKQFRVATTQIDQLVRNLCDDVTRGFNNSTPAKTLAASPLAGATLADLDAVGRVVSRVVRECSGITTFDAETLMGGLTNYVASKTQLAKDVVPPRVLGPTWTRCPRFPQDSCKQSSVSLTWLALDGGSGVKSYDLWVSKNSRWERVTPAAGWSIAGWFYPIVQNIDYVFAVRATDKAGNLSAWEYSSPCSCKLL